VREKDLHLHRFCLYFIKKQKDGYMAKKAFLQSKTEGMIGKGFYFTNSSTALSQEEAVILPKKTAHIYNYDLLLKKVTFLLDTNPDILDVLPLVKYHGTSIKNLEFSDPKPGKKTGKPKQQIDFGTHFSTKKYASGYVAKQGSLHKKLVFGKKTLDLNVGYWPSAHPDFNSILSLIKKLGIEKKRYSLDYSHPKTGKQTDTIQAVKLTAPDIDALPPRHVYETLISEGYDTVAYMPYTVVYLPLGGMASIPHEKSIVALTKDVIRDVTPENIVEVYAYSKDNNINSDFVFLIDSLISKSMPFTDKALSDLMHQSDTFSEFLQSLGAPLYHGYSYEKIDYYGDEYDGITYDKPDGLRGKGWFTSDQFYAESYTDGEGEILPMTLRMNKPFFISVDPETQMTTKDFISLTGISFKSPFENDAMHVYDFYDSSRTDFQKTLEKHGYDGIITIEGQHSSFLPFNDSQMLTDKDLWNMWLLEKNKTPIINKDVIEQRLNSFDVSQFNKPIDQIASEWANSHRIAALQNARNEHDYFGYFIPLYHGTSELFDTFDVTKTADGTLWFSSNETLVKNGLVGASGNAYCIERFIDEKILRLAGWEEHEKFSVNELIDLGFDGVKLVESDQITFRLFNSEQIYTKDALRKEWAREHLKPISSPYKCSSYSIFFSKYDSFKTMLQKEKLMTGHEVADALEDMGTSEGFSQYTLDAVKKKSYMLMEFTFNEIRSLDPSFNEFLESVVDSAPARARHVVKISDSMHPVMYSDGTICDGYHRLAAYYAAGVEKVTLLVGMDPLKMNEAWNILEKNVSDDRDKHQTLRDVQIAQNPKKELPFHENVEALLFSSESKATSFDEKLRNAASFEQFLSLLGKPLYHGTRAEFTTFDSTYASSKQASGARGSLDGFYFTSDKSVAETYGPNIKECYVILGKPFIGDPYAYLASELDAEMPSFGSPPHVFEGYNTKINKDTVAHYFKSHGYDGIVIPARTRYFDFDETIVFDPENIKTKEELSVLWERNHPSPAQITNPHYFLYHGTSPGAARRIQKEGLLPGQAIGTTSLGDGAYVFLTTSLKTAESYATRKDNGYVLRVKKTFDMLPDFARVGNKKNRDYITSMPVTSDLIEIRTHNGSWMPLVDFSFEYPVTNAPLSKLELDYKKSQDTFLKPIVSNRFSMQDLFSRALCYEKPSDFVNSLPLLYHQSQSKEAFDSFLQRDETGYSPASYSQALYGVYFSPNKELVQSKYNKNDGLLISAYITASNVLDLGEYDAMYYTDELCVAGQVTVENFKRSLRGESPLPDPDLELSSISDDNIKWLKQKGYDAIEGMKGPGWSAPEVVVFDNDAIITSDALVDIWHAAQDKQKIFLLNSALRFKDFDDFSKDYSINGNHGIYYHLTDIPEWHYAASLGARDMSSMGSGTVLQQGSLMITADLSYWNEYYNSESVTRPYVAILDVSDIPKLNTVERGFGHEIYLTPADAALLKTVTVLPLEKALIYEKNYNTYIPQSKEELRSLWEEAWNNKKNELYKNKIDILTAKADTAVTYDDFVAQAGKHVYHGTSNHFDVFQFSPGLRSYGDFSEYSITSSALFFTESKFEAWKWAQNRAINDGKPIVMDAYLDIDSTIDLTGNNLMEQWITCASHKGVPIEVTLFEYFRDFDPVLSKWTSQEWLEVGIDSDSLKILTDFNVNILLDEPAFVAALQKFGYDSALLTEYGNENSIAVFNPCNVYTAKELESAWKIKEQHISQNIPLRSFGNIDVAGPLSVREIELFFRTGYDAIELHHPNGNEVVLYDKTRFVLTEKTLSINDPQSHDAILSSYGKIFYRGVGKDTDFTRADLLGKGTYYIDQDYIAEEFGTVSKHVIPESVVLFRKFSNEKEYALFLKTMEDINPLYYDILKKEATHFNISCLDLTLRTSLPLPSLLPESVRDLSQKKRDSWWRSIIKQDISNVLELMGYDGIISSEGKIAGKYEDLTLYGLSVREAQERGGYFPFNNVVIFPGHDYKVFAADKILSLYDKTPPTLETLLQENKTTRNLRYCPAELGEESSPLLNYRKESQIHVMMAPEKYLAFVAGNKPGWEWNMCVDLNKLIEIKEKLLQGTHIDRLYIDYSTDGTVVGQEGRHRAIVASLLGIPEIPVIVYVQNENRDYIPALNESEKIKHRINTFVIPDNLKIIDPRLILEPPWLERLFPNDVKKNTPPPVKEISILD